MPDLPATISQPVVYLFTNGSEQNRGPFVCAARFEKYRRVEFTIPFKAVSYRIVFGTESIEQLVCLSVIKICEGIPEILLLQFAVAQGYGKWKPTDGFGIAFQAGEKLVLESNLISPTGISMRFDLP